MFKVWSKVSKCWVGGLVAIFQDGTIGRYSTNTKCFDILGKEEFEIIKCTGLKDKNGKEICEGDIYHMGDKNIRYLVVWNDTGLIGKQLGSNSYAGLSHWQDKIEIIGNMYDNPKLLKRN